MSLKPSLVSLAEAEVLVAELHRLGVRHLARLNTAVPAPAMPPAQLLAALAQDSQARLRGALILLFLRRPDFSADVPKAVAMLDDPATVTLKLYYQAAGYLQDELEPILRQQLAGWQPLPDLFSVEFDLPSAGAVSVGAALAALGEVHRRLSGRDYNWTGSYRQHVGVFLRQLTTRHGTIDI
jgi:hypothetical protein